MRIELNGEPRLLGDAATLAEAVREAGAAPEGRGVAVAVDGEVVPRGEWEATVLREGQKVEVLAAIQGGPRRRPRRRPPPGISAGGPGAPA